MKNAPWNARLNALSIDAVGQKLRQLSLVIETSSHPVLLCNLTQLKVASSYNAFGLAAWMAYSSLSEFPSSTNVRKY